MKAPKAPTPPDPVKVGAAQTGTNVATAIANQLGGMTGQNTPYGSLSYDQTGSFSFTDPNSGKSYELPRFTANQTMTPAGQKIHNNTMGAQIGMAQAANTAANKLSGIMGTGPVGGGPMQMGVKGGGNIRMKVDGGGPITRSYNTDFSKDRAKVEAAVMSRINPQMQQQFAGREAQLRAQGITMGSAAYDRAMAQQNNMATDARMQAVLTGGQEQSRMVGLERDRAMFQNAAQGQQFGQNLAQNQFANQAQGQQFGQNLAQGQFANQAQGAQYNQNLGLRNQSINEIQALLGGSQVQAPNYVNTPGVNMPTTDYAGLYQQNYANQLGAYQTKMQSWNGMMGGLMGGGALIGAAKLGG